MRLPFVLALVVVVLLAAWSLFLNRGRLELVTSLSHDVERKSVLDAPNAQTAREVLHVEKAEPAPHGDDASAAPAPTSAGTAGNKKSATLEIRITRDGFPVPGVGVWLASEVEFGIEPPTLHDEKVPFPVGAKFVESRPDGIAVFESASLRNHYAAFDLTPSHPRPTRFISNPVVPARTYEVRVGSARILGRVFGDDGLPESGVSLGVQPTDPDPVTKMFVRAYTRTNAHGDFEVGDLIAGGYEVVLERDGRFDGKGSVEEQTVMLSDGETRHVQFGGTALGARWSGRVLTARGETFEGTGVLRIERIDEPGEKSTTIGSDGRFAMPITAGKWRILAQVTGSPDSGHELGEIQLEDRDLERDLIVPGARVSGRVIGLAPELLADPKGSPILSFRLEGQDYPAAIRSVSLRTDGSFVIDGLEVGRFEVSLWPHELREARPVVEILAGVGLLQRDFDVNTK